jgi:hypothetical protein
MCQALSTLGILQQSKNDPLSQFAQYLHGIEPDIAEETFRKWLHVLAKQAWEGLRERKTVEMIGCLDAFHFFPAGCLHIKFSRIHSLYLARSTAIIDWPVRVVALFNLL